MLRRYFTVLFSPRSPGACATRIVLLITTVVVLSFALGLIHTPTTKIVEKERDLNPNSKPFIPDTAPYFPVDQPVVVRFTSNLTRQNGGKKEACPLPRLELHDPAIMSFYVKHPRIKCDVEPNWVLLHAGRFIILPEAVEKHGKIECDLYPVVKNSDFKVDEQAPLRNVANGTRFENDFYRISCVAKDGAKYENYHAGIRYDEKVQSRPVPESKTGLNLDVIMIGLDSTSRLAWRRHLPLTRDYFTSTLGGVELEGYNILGDGTPAAIMPILIGKREEELPEARRGYSGAKPVDSFPWIWKEFRDAGYAVAWGEDDAHLGTFQYRLLGFSEQPTDHYYRYFSLALEPHYKDNKPFCVGSRPRHLVLQDYMREMYYMYPNRRKWIFSFQSELSHQDNNNLSKMDDDFYEHIKRLHEEGFLDNAILIMMADHGARFSKVRATAQGKQEERLPYFGIRFPEWFKKKYPEIIQNVLKNSKRLTTPFDIHETFHDILNFTGTGPADISKRGVSLFKEIPPNRDCSSAEVDPHWCACMEWVDLNMKDPILDRLTEKILETFNNYTEPHRDLCAKLSIDKLISAKALKVMDAVLKFKDTSDGGRGRFGKMDDTTQHTSILYQIIFQTTPGAGLFEVTLTHRLKEDQIILEKKDVSRANKYGNAAACIETQDAFLRPYCYCKST
ncbi:uncharacterized protein LOC131929743 [Physella acuta]|uniref:uncharacterized protein LOC131929743 n=1 Tax=Physella acuta TaxID=109671 RepID=UPI0027DE7F78|nr:uncharacterized protein LOC131929743 [Physella acuta]